MNISGFTLAVMKLKHHVTFKYPFRSQTANSLQWQAVKRNVLFIQSKKVPFQASFGLQNGSCTETCTGVTSGLKLPL